MGAYSPPDATDDGECHVGLTFCHADMTFTRSVSAGSPVMAAAGTQIRVIG